MNPRIELEEMTPQRVKQARVTAVSILESYGRGKAERRAKEISAGTRNLSPGNKLFYDRVSELVREGVDHGTVEGKKVAWR